MIESEFQSHVISKIKQRFEGCFVMKVNPFFYQGIPDVLVLYRDRWALLELKKSKKEKRQPNQEYYVDLLNKMSFSRIVYPENLNEVLDELQRSFEH